MIFTAGTGLLEAVVLAIISRDATTGSYGYKITQDTMKLMDISESTLYPVLRRLKAEKLLDTYDRAFDGRNRRYYVLTGAGKEKLREYATEWKDYTARITALLEEVRYD